MPILAFTIRSQELDAGLKAKKTIKLEQTFKMEYLKLLHIYHNIDNNNISNGAGTSRNTILFAKIGFLNSQQALFTEIKDNQVIEHGGLVCLGETIKEENSNTFRDCYKVLHDGKDTLYINQPFEVELFKLESKDPATENSDEAVYNATGSHLIAPMTKGDFQGGLDSAGQYISFIFEYRENYSK
tara:strand:- start:392 stop:946 length:555 start_codon:yes stop_codon:yes gene_type:complete